MHFVHLFIKFLNQANLRKIFKKFSCKCVAILSDVCTSVTVTLGVSVSSVDCLTEKGFVLSIERWRKSGNPAVTNIKLHSEISL